jgi:hypothetical protein
MPVGAVVAGDVVVVSQRGACSDGHGLLADVRVRHADEFSRLHEVDDRLIEPADQHHPPQHPHILLSIVVHLGLHTLVCDQIAPAASIRDE